MSAVYLVLRHVDKVGFVLDVEDDLPQYSDLVVGIASYGNSWSVTTRREAVRSLWVGLASEMLNCAQYRDGSYTTGTRLSPLEGGLVEPEAVMQAARLHRRG